MSGTAKSRLSQIRNFITGTGAQMATPWDPESTQFPSRSQLPALPGAPKDAAWVWGPEDQLGRLNLLTPTRVKAASAEIRTGELIPVNLPLNVPEQPSFGRETFQHTIKSLHDGVAFDDLYHLNTQSGTQWDGFRHFSHLSSQTFYNGAKKEDIMGDAANDKCSVHFWSQHGIAGRGVLLDYWGYAQSKGIKYDPYEHHSISWEELRACGTAQGIDIRPAAQGGDIKVGDILFVRSGFNVAYQNRSSEERAKAALRQDPDLKWAGLEQSEAMLDWLHDSYFAAVAGDAPSFEAWPTKQEYYMHEYILALWGMPLGEMLDLEKLAKRCRETGRWVFFFVSSPANVERGVSSHVNGTAIL
ncbi:hypothetical protein H072_11096 [Dactylellina haptotyla CBS 200.50]|uniref:Cyclase n=1 Tax=Dactylellina haptotyla (strain CBS 200.50) TaxID=1284197 RepID=S8BJR5_DACHA|nr:hypothetical protein H072_11096 [Dactylellina haptotyla CBS 200.50]